MEIRAQVQIYVNQTEMTSGLNLNLQCNYFTPVERHFCSKSDELGENC